MIRRRGAAALPLALLGALAVGARPAAAQVASEIIGRAARTYRDAEPIRADFTQVIVDRMVGTFESRGTLVQGVHGKLQMRFSDPKGDAIVVDGTRIWVYTPSTTPGQVLRLAVKASPVYGYNVLDWLIDRPTERYKLTWLRTETIGGRPTDAVEMVPQVADLPFTKAVLWIDQGDGLPRRFEFTERSGATRTLTLSKIRPNQRVDDAAFRFDLPAGVRVIDQ